MKTAVTVLLLLFLIGCERSSQPTSPVLSGSKTGNDTLSSIGILSSIGSQSDSVHEINFAWKDSTGKMDSLSEYRGKTVLLNFWATWCPPCQEEIPALKDIAGNSGDTVAVIGVSCDKSDNTFQTVSNFVASKGMNYKIVVDSTNVLFVDYVSAYHGSHGIPETYIIGKDGTVKFVLLGSQSEQAFRTYISKAN